MNSEHHRCCDRQCDCVEAFDWVIGYFVEQGGIDDKGTCRDKKGVSVGRHLCDASRTDVAAGSANVLDVELFAQIVRELLRDQAPEHVSWTRGCKRYDNGRSRCARIWRIMPSICATLRRFSPTWNFFNRISVSRDFIDSYSAEIARPWDPLPRRRSPSAGNERCTPYL